jgi:DNA-binding MarR family transcriptional regulator
MAKRPVWLTEDQQRTWRSLLLMTQLLDEALDRQLQADSGMAHSHYGILVALSEAEGRSLRMSDLAAALRYSQSRLTHAVARLERDGWVRREPCATDRRGLNAVLTDEGLVALQAAAPGHVREVRALVFDRLSPDQVEQLHAISDALLDGLDGSGGARAIFAHPPAT